MCQIRLKIVDVLKSGLGGSKLGPYTLLIKDGQTFIYS